MSHFGYPPDPGYAAKRLTEQRQLKFPFSPVYFFMMADLCRRAK
jgi:hypothetical protein